MSRRSARLRMYTLLSLAEFGETAADEMYLLNERQKIMETLG